MEKKRDDEFPLIRDDVDFERRPPLSPPSRLRVTDLSFAAKFVRRREGGGGGGRVNITNNNVDGAADANNNNDDDEKRIEDDSQQQQPQTRDAAASSDFPSKVEKVSGIENNDDDEEEDDDDENLNAEAAPAAAPAKGSVAAAGAAKGGATLKPPAGKSAMVTESTQTIVRGGQFSQRDFEQHFYTKSFELLVADIETGIRKGHKPELIKQGTSGSYFCRGENNEIAGVFKPKSEEPYGPANPKIGKKIQRIFCPCMFGRGCLLDHQGYLSEAGAYLVDVKLGLGIVPMTNVAWLASDTFNYSKTARNKVAMKSQINKRYPAIGAKFHRLGLKPKVGSLQQYVKDYKDGNIFLSESGDLNRLPVKHRTTFMLQFERMVALDYIIRNTDRGGTNWLVKYEGKYKSKKGRGISVNYRTEFNVNFHDENDNDDENEDDDDSLDFGVAFNGGGRGGGGRSSGGGGFKKVSVGANRNGNNENESGGGGGGGRPPEEEVPSSDEKGSVEKEVSDSSTQTKHRDSLGSLKIGAIRREDKTKQRREEEEERKRIEELRMKTSRVTFSDFGNKANLNQRTESLDTPDEADEYLNINAEERKKILLAAIDNGLAFPFKHPDEWRGYPFHWAGYSFAKTPFSEETRTLLIEKLSDMAFIEAMVDDLFALFSLDPDFSMPKFDKQMGVMRGQILNLIQALKDAKSPAELVQMDCLLVERRYPRRATSFHDGIDDARGRRQVRVGSLRIRRTSSAPPSRFNLNDEYSLMQQRKRPKCGCCW